MWEILAVLIGSILTRFISLDIERRKSIINIKMDMLDQCESIYEELYSELNSVSLSDKNLDSLWNSCNRIKHIAIKIDAVKNTIELLSMDSKYIDELSELKLLIDDWICSSSRYCNGNISIKSISDENGVSISTIYRRFYKSTQEILDKNIHSIKILRAEVLTNICDKKKFCSLMFKK